MTWHRAVGAGFVVGGPIFVALHLAREGEVARGTRAAPPAAAVAVSGTLALLGAESAVGDAVVYLEPVDEPRPAAAAPAAAVAPVPAAPARATRPGCR